MQITLNNEEIETAIKNYVRTIIAISEDQDIVIDMKAGRLEKGMSATLDIVPMNQAGEMLPPKTIEPAAPIPDTPAPVHGVPAASTKPVAVKALGVSALKKPEPVEEVASAGEAEATETSDGADVEVDAGGADVDEVDGGGVEDQVETEPQVETAPAPKRSIFAKAGA